MEGIKRKVRVWDPFVRLFHWTLAASFAMAYLTAEELEGAHALLGYTISGLLLFRFVWGLIGSRHARFSDFIYSPREVFGYLKGVVTGAPKHYLGHNPAGGLMVILLLLSLSATCLSGLKAYGAEGHGPLAGGGPSLVSVAHADGGEDEEGREGRGHGLWEELHEVFANLTLVLIAGHITGVIVSSVIHRENLIKAMVTGNKES